MQEFKAFILRGNVIDLAVAFVLGVAFTAVVTSVVENIIAPLITMFGGEPNLRSLDFTINDAVFGYGDVLTEIINFVILAAVVFFLVVKPMNVLLARVRRGEEVVDEPAPVALSPEARRFIDELTVALQGLETRRP